MAVRTLSSPVVFSTTELDAVLRVARCCSPDATGRVSAHKTRSCPQGDRHPVINKPSTIVYCVSVSLFLLLDPPWVGVCEPFEGAVAALGDFLAFVILLISFLVWVGGESKCHFRLKHRA